MFRRVLILIWLVVAAVSLLPGLGYYVTPIQERGYSDLHEQFSPAGIVGHGFGVVGTLLLTVGVILYSARKRLERLSKLGNLKHWLDFHIFLCTLGPFLVVLHTSFKFGGIVSIAFWSMMAVVLSGVFGRYVYVWIPKTLNGRFLSVQSIQEQKEHLIKSIHESSGLPSGEVQRILGSVESRQPRGILGALLLSTRFRLAKRSRQKTIMNLLAAEGIPGSTRVPTAWRSVSAPTATSIPTTSRCLSASCATTTTSRRWMTSTPTSRAMCGKARRAFPATRAGRKSENRLEHANIRPGRNTPRHGWIAQFQGHGSRSAPPARHRLHRGQHALHRCRN